MRNMENCTGFPNDSNEVKRIIQKLSGLEPYKPSSPFKPAYNAGTESESSDEPAVRLSAATASNDQLSGDDTDCELTKDT
jgi:hypothetical protein